MIFDYIDGAENDGDVCFVKTLFIILSIHSKRAKDALALAAGQLTPSALAQFSVRATLRRARTTTVRAARTDMVLN